MWCKELKKNFPTVPDHFIRVLSKAYSLNPSKYDRIIAEDKKLPPPEQDKPGTYNAVHVYNSVDAIPNIDNNTEFNAKECFVE